jgi:hypothetical protein
MAKTEVTMEEVAEVIEQAVAAEEARQADAAAVEPPAPPNTRTYTVHATHPPQAIALNNAERVGIVSSILCTGPCKLVLREADGGKVLISIDSADGFDAPLAIAFTGPLVAELKTDSSISFTLIY